MTLMQTITFAPSLSLSQSLFLDFRLMLYRPLFQMCTPSLQSMGLVLHILLKLILYCVTHKKKQIPCFLVYWQIPVFGVPQQMQPMNPPQQAQMVISHCCHSVTHFYYRLHDDL